MLKTSWLSPVRERCAPLILIPTMLLSALLLVVAAPASASAVYDFSSGGGTNHFAWGTYSDSWGSDVEGQRRKTPEVGTQVTSVQADAYGRLAASDATGGASDSNRYWNPDDGPGTESTLIVEFNIAENSGDVTQLDVLWEGFAHDDDHMELYIWNYTLENWSDGKGGDNNFMDDNPGGSADFILQGSVTSNFGDYISGAGQITLLIYDDNPVSGATFHDYVSITVTATTPAVPAMSDGLRIVLVLLLSVLGAPGVVAWRRKALA